MVVLRDTDSMTAARTTLEAHRFQIGGGGLGVELPARTSQQKVPRGCATQLHGHPFELTEKAESPMWIDASQLKSVSSTEDMATEDLPWLHCISSTNTFVPGNINPFSSLQPVQTTLEEGLLEELSNQVDHASDSAREAPKSLMANRPQKNATNFHAGYAASTQWNVKSVERRGSRWGNLVYTCKQDQLQGMPPQVGFQFSEDQFTMKAGQEKCKPFFPEYSCPIKPFDGVALDDSIGSTDSMGSTDPVSPGLLEMSVDVPDPPTVGSWGHPVSCAVACKYAYKARGCKDGANCTRCHLCPWRRKCARADMGKDDSEASPPVSGRRVDLLYMGRNGCSKWCESL